MEKPVLRSPVAIKGSTEHITRRLSGCTVFWESRLCVHRPYVILTTASLCISGCTLFLPKYHAVLSTPRYSYENVTLHYWLNVFIIMKMSCGIISLVLFLWTSICTVSLILLWTSLCIISLVLLLWTSLCIIDPMLFLQASLCITDPTPVLCECHIALPSFLCNSYKNVIPYHKPYVILTPSPGLITIPMPLKVRPDRGHVLFLREEWITLPKTC
jgi:hypothetical protein